MMARVRFRPQLMSLKLNAPAYNTCIPASANRKKLSLHPVFPAPGSLFQVKRSVAAPDESEAAHMTPSDPIYAIKGRNHELE